MKKTLIALAGMALAGTALAQSSVTIYGAIDNSFTRVTNKGGASASGLSSGGGGSMGLETSSGANGVPGSNNNSTIIAPGGGLRFDRAAYVSLSGGYGEIRLGRDLAASFINDVIYDPFLTYGVGSSLNFPLGVLGSLFAPPGVAASSIGKDASSLFRLSNGISYITPGNLGGFSAQLQFAPSEQASNTGVAERNGRIHTGRVAFDKGPVSVSISGGKADQSSATLGQDVSTYNAGGSFDFGVVKVMGEYAQYKTENATGVSGQDFTTKIVTLGVIAPVGPGKVKLGLSQAKRDIDGFANEPKATKIALGYDYSLSKRTSLFATVASVKNSNGSAVSASDGGVAGFGSSAAVNKRSTGYDVGILHSF
jgi:predicted porin